MNSRERWTVYPLLFLTLGISVKDKLTRSVHTDQIVAKSLLLTDRLPENGQVRMPPGQLACRSVIVIDADLEPQVVLTSSPDRGGVITAMGKFFPNIVMGHVDFSGSPVTGIMFDYPRRRLPVAMQPASEPRVRARAAAEEATEVKSPTESKPPPGSEPEFDRDSIKD